MIGGQQNVKILSLTVRVEKSAIMLMYKISLNKMARVNHQL